MQTVKIEQLLENLKDGADLTGLFDDNDLSELSTVTLTVTTPGEVETLEQAVDAVTVQCGRARPETCREVSPWK